VIQRLLEERRQYEAWITRLQGAADATVDGVRARVRADYEARLAAVTEELKAHAASARQAIEQKRHLHRELQKKEGLVAEKLTETELRHAVGEYDETQWGQVHKDVQSELVAVREELQAVEADIEKLLELDTLVSATPSAPLGSPSPARERTKADQAEELAFIKSVTEDATGGAPSPRRASGAQFQPAIPLDTPSSPSAPRAATPAPAPIVPEAAGANGDEEAAKTLRCQECGTMNLPTEWYCAHCGAELAAV
jgi:hypothetical protein